MASASLLKTSPAIGKTDFIKGQALRQSSVSVRCHPAPPSGLTVRASSYADELVKTAVRAKTALVYVLLIHEFCFFTLSVYFNVFVIGK